MRRLLRCGDEARAERELRYLAALSQRKGGAAESAARRLAQESALSRRRAKDAALCEEKGRQRRRCTADVEMGVAREMRSARARDARAAARDTRTQPRDRRRLAPRSAWRVSREQRRGSGPSTSAAVPAPVHAYLLRRARRTLRCASRSHGFATHLSASRGVGMRRCSAAKRLPSASSTRGTATHRARAAAEALLGSQLASSSSRLLQPLSSADLLSTVETQQSASRYARSRGL
jgi:hypothetical protein